MSIILQNTSDDLSLRADGGIRTTKFAGDIPKHVEGAAEAIYTALHTFLRYDHIPNPTGGPDVPWVAEIRIPGAKQHKTTGTAYTSVEAAWFDKSGIDDIAAELASNWCQPPLALGPYEKYAEGGIYWTINPITPAYLENYGSRLQRRRTGTARDVDVVARYWLPIDADAVRRDQVTGAPLAVVSSTVDEKAAIARLIDTVRDYLVGTHGWPRPVQIDTGNGYADFYALPGIPIPRCPDPDNPGCLKYDVTADTLIRDVIHALSHKFTGELGSIDDAVFNPSRIMKIPGTWARKAKHITDRPHRASKILYIPPDIVPVTVEQLQLVLAQNPQHFAPKRGHATPTRGARAKASPNGHPSGAGATRPEGGGQQGQAPGKSPLERAKVYIDKVPGAVSGAGGHQTTWEALALPIRRFDLPRDAAEELAAYYNERCEPPWSEAELAHKLNDIYRDRYGADDWGKYVTEGTGDEDEPTEGPPPDEEAAASPSGPDPVQYPEPFSI